MSTVRKLSYRSDLCELKHMCRDVSDYCREHSVDADTALALTLCLDELFTNTLKHGYGAAADAAQRADALADLLVEIHLECHEDRVLVRYYDSGQPFDPFDSLPPLPDVATIAPETLPTSGFGIHLLRKLCTEARYAREGDRNTVSLSFVWR